MPIVKREPYSLSLISAISHDQVIANQLIEGGVDSSVFENFIYTMLLHLRTTDKYKGARIILLMDNATIHRHPGVSKTILEMKAFLMFNP